MGVLSLPHREVAFDDEVRTDEGAFGDLQRFALLFDLTMLERVRERLDAGRSIGVFFLDV